MYPKYPKSPKFKNKQKIHQKANKVRAKHPFVFLKNVQNIQNIQKIPQKHQNIQKNTKIY